MECKGTATDHCCWIGGKVCTFLEENVEGRRWSCALRRELGSWEKVHNDPRYVSVVLPRLEAAELHFNCGDWPRFGELCATCGVTGDG